MQDMHLNGHLIQQDLKNKHVDETEGDVNAYCKSKRY